MLRYLLLILFFSFSILLLSTSLEDNPQRLMDVSLWHDSNNVMLRTTNYGVFGSASNQPRWPSLEYPHNSGLDHLYIGSVWISGKKIRRDGEGRRLFWNPNPVNHNDVVAENSTGFDPIIHTDLVVDTLSSVGFDGDASLYELLPAYNPLETNHLGNQYANYNHLDVALRSIEGYPAPSDQNFPFCDDDIFGFFLPSTQIGTFPGVETITSFYYDYSPFGTPGKRNYGHSSAAFDHFPLDIALRQRSFTWTWQDLFDMVFFSFDIYNANALDTLYDIAMSMYMDCDVGPQIYPGDETALNDVSGYYAGEGYEFAYTRDYDGDSPYWMALKLFVDNDHNHAAWSWVRGDGPDDRRPLYLTPWGGQVTSNEKYWLMTGKNPDSSKFLALRPPDWTPDMNPHFEEEIPNDTRFLYSIYGDMQGFTNPGPETLNIAPGQSLSAHGVIFFGTSLDQLKDRSLIATAFYESGYDHDLYAGVPAIPFITAASHYDGEITVNWFRSDGADEQYFMHKLADEPDNAWQSIEVGALADSYVLTDTELYNLYEIKIANVFGDVYFESNTRQVYTSHTTVESNFLPDSSATMLIGNYPNPFNPDTKIYFSLERSGSVTLEIFNLKGQLVSNLAANEYYPSGLHSIHWNGKDSTGKDIPSGIYFYRFSTDERAEVRKMLLLK